MCSHFGLLDVKGQLGQALVAAVSGASSTAPAAMELGTHISRMSTIALEIDDDEALLRAEMETLAQRQLAC